MALKKVKDLKNSEKYLLIHGELNDQLERNGTKNSCYDDMVDAYMTMWVTTQLLQQDIEKRGVQVLYNNGGGQKGRKKNESIQEYNKTNAQMLNLLSKIGLSHEKIDGGVSEEL